MSKKVCILGDGNFGTAMAQLIAQNGFEVNLWCNNAEIAKSINENNINNVYLPNIKLHQNINAFTDIAQAISDCEIIFEAIPVKFLRSVLQRAKNHYNPEQTWVVLSKGIEQGTFFIPSQILDEVFSNVNNKAVLLGPSFSHDLLHNKFTGVNLYASSDSIFQKLKEILENVFFRIKKCEDLIGMQVCAAFKNVIAIAMGITSSEKFGQNARAYIFTKCIDELNILLNNFGVKAQTIFTLAGIGDLVLTCFGAHSKNYNFGLQIGQGRKLEQIIVENSSIAEGVNTLKSLHEFMTSKKIDLTIFNDIYQIVFEDKDVNCLITSNV